MKKTSQKIVEYIKNNKQVTGPDLIDYLGISDRAVRKQIKNLLDRDVITKIGKPPKVFYLIKNPEKQEDFKIDKKKEEFIKENYLIITASGERKEGLDGFVYWCKKNSLDINSAVDDYIKTIKKYDKYKKKGIINGNFKFKNTFEKTFLNNAYYLDFYSIERFGKTKLGQLLLYGKQSGDKKIIKDIVEIVKPRIEEIIKIHKIDAVGFIPWTIKRDIQFMRELERGLKLNINTIKIEKIKTEVVVPQKTLKKIGDRIENAEKTIILLEDRKYNNILLIDDAVGSGATLNQTAKKIKERGTAKRVIGVAITGSFEGLDVISEV